VPAAQGRTGAAGQAGNRPPISRNLSTAADPGLVTPDLPAIIFQPTLASVPRRCPPDQGGEGRGQDQDTGEHVAGSAGPVSTGIGIRQLSLTAARYGSQSHGLLCRAN
jgi:hypothetical protein